LRIIGGSLKKKNLLSVPGMATRPTSDRLRENVFNIISRHVRESVVLDLFAGTGALGLEALSRGAEFSAFVEYQKEALAVIRKNIESCRFTDVTLVYPWDIEKNLACLANPHRLFDLVFMDPPYGMDLIPKTLVHLADARCLADRALIVAEHGSQESVLPLAPGFTVTDLRKYGKSSVTFLEYSDSDKTLP
jgi:16S rRNA (guanine966-N2)-methyltransferase